MDVDVFLSVGRTETEAQEEFVRAVEACLKQHDLRPRNLGRDEWSSQQPLLAVQERMRECAGTAVVAFERVRVRSAVDHQGTEEPEPLQDQKLPTVWNQIEATMAYTLGHPLLVIAEDGLRSEGVLESRYDWLVQWLPLDPSALRTPRALGIIADWKKRVLRYHQEMEEARSSTDIGEKSIGQLLGELRPAHARGLVVGTAAVLTAAFTLGATIG